MTEKRKKLLLFSIIGVAVCILAVAVFALGKNSVSDEEPESAVSNEEGKNDTEKVEMISYEDGSYPLEDAMAQAAGYDAVYEKLAEYFQTMYTGGETGLIQGADLPDIGGSIGDYDPQKAIVFSEVPEYQDAKEDLYVSDGEYAYLVKKDNTIAIMKLEDTMEALSIISGHEHNTEYVVDLHVSGDRLVLINHYSEMMNDVVGAMRYSTMIYTYNIADRMQPILMGSTEMEGYYIGSRMSDSYLYVYTSCHKDGFISQEGSLVPVKDLEPSDYVPSVNGEVLSAENIYMPEKVNDNYYIMTAAIDTESPEQPKDVKTFLSADAKYYAGENGIYLLLQGGLYHVSSTVIIRLDFVNGEVHLTSAGSIAGIVNGNNAMCEKDGLLRVVSSLHAGNESKNYLYVLDQQFGIVAKSDSLAKGELIQSVRFIHDKLYLATYGKMPIVSVNLSDVQAPKETAQPKPDGFDGLLCAFGEDQILGISYIINQTTMAYEGIRLTMFDTSAEDTIFVADTLDIQADTTPVATDQSALLLDLTNGLIGFSTEDWDEGYTHVDNYYRVARYSAEEGFVNVLNAQLSQGNCWKTRGFASENAFYVADQDGSLLKSFDMTNGFAQTGEINY